VGPIGLPGLNGQNALTAPDFFVLGGGGLPFGSVITAFIVNGTTVISTAPSGQISSQPQFSAVPGPVVGAGLPGLLSMLLGGGWLWRRRPKVVV